MTGGPIPGQRTGRSTSPRDVLASYEGVRYGRGVIDAARAFDGKVVAGNSNVDHEFQFHPGTFLGQITASKLWVPCKRTNVTSDGGATDVDIPVNESRFFRVGDEILVAAAEKVIIAVDYDDDIITVDGSSFAFANDALIVGRGNSAGAGTARSILNEFIDLKSDEDRVARNRTFGQGVLMGMVKTALLLGDVASIRADTGSMLTMIQFDDDAGQA